MGAFFRLKVIKISVVSENMKNVDRIELNWFLSDNYVLARPVHSQVNQILKPNSFKTEQCLELTKWRFTSVSANTKWYIRSGRTIRRRGHNIWGCICWELSSQLMTLEEKAGKGSHVAHWEELAIWALHVRTVCQVLLPSSLSELTVTGGTCKLYQQDTDVIVRNSELSNDFWTFKLNFRKVIYKTILASRLRDKARKYDRLLKWVQWLYPSADGHQQKIEI